jgi:hypothetical protein
MVLRRGSLTRLALAVLVAAPLFGCEWKRVTVQLPTFFSAGVEELHFWRLDEATSDYVRAGHIRFSGLIGPPGAQTIHYTMVSPDGEPTTFALTSDVEVLGDSIVLELWYARWPDEGTFRVSARNSAGESGLSEGDIAL